MVDEVAKTVITVPMCLREVGNQGFPPSDRALRGWFYGAAASSNPASTQKILETLVSSILAVLHRRLEAIASDIPELPNITNVGELSSPERGKYASLIRQRHERLAFAFRKLMTGYQSFEQHSAYRQTFYEEVIELATEFSRGNEDVPGAKLPGFPEYTYRHQGIRAAAENLCKFVDPSGLLDVANGPRHPLVILAFDKYQFMDAPQPCGWTTFSMLIHALRKISPLPIFSLFVSTTGKIRPPAPKITPHHGDCVFDPPPPLQPITEIVFDDLAFPALENTVSLDRVTQADWMSHLGRPLFGAYWDALAGDDSEKELLRFAKQKLLNGKPILVDGDRPGSLACLAVRFALKFNSDAISGGIVCTQVEHHMQLILAATTGFETLVTITGSEPLLAEAASQLTHESRAIPVHNLVHNVDLDCIDHGRRGDLVAALLIMQARDAAALVSKNGRWMSVSDFLQALLPQSAYETLQRSLPTFWREGEDTSFTDTFKDYAMWFNHVIRVEDDEMINSEFLWMFITRGAMIMCPHNQYGVDIVLPACLMKGSPSRDTVTAVLIRVKNIEYSGHHVDETSFDLMDPFMGLFSDEQEPRPVIRMVLGLGSTVPGVLFPAAREHDPLTSSQFTSFDIWCSGLSEDTYKGVGDDLASYQLLLRRLRRSQYAFNLDDSETNVGHDPDARNTREFARERMVPLTGCGPGHNAIHA